MQRKNKHQIDWMLIARYISRTMTEIEHLRLQHWLKGDRLRRRFLEHAQHYYSREDFPLPDKKRIDRIWSEFFVRMQQKQVRRLWTQVGSVAAVVLLVGSIWMWHTFEKGPDRLMSEHILPVHQKAILILSDGSSVLLDTDTEKRTLTDRDVRIDQQKKGLFYTADAKIADTLYNTIQVPQGGEYRLVLSDGTQIWLNAQTRFTYPVAFGKGERRVRLEGEAYFEVMPGKSCFIVETQRMQVRVLGTSFNVNAYPDDKATLTTLLEGKVEVSAGGGNRILQPGEQASRETGETGEIRVNRVNAQHYIQWKEGYFSFRNSTLEEIMHVLARWYDMEYEFDSPDLKELRFFGMLSRFRDVKELLREFEKTGRVTFGFEGNKVLISPGV